jgi:hypothetical protein
MQRLRMVSVLAIVAFAFAALLAACGGSDVTGTYTWGSGEESVKDLTLEIKGDDTFVLSGESAVMGNVSIQGKYTLDADQISLTMPGNGGSTESEVGTWGDGKLVFEDVTWQKE